MLEALWSLCGSHLIEVYSQQELTRHIHSSSQLEVSGVVGVSILPQLLNLLFRDQLGVFFRQHLLLPLQVDLVGLGELIEWSGRLEFRDHIFLGEFG